MDENAFDITVVGTGLTESIVAAALSKTGLRVLHIDTELNYGSSDATLTLIDLHHLLLSPPAELADISVPVPIPESLLRDSRNYAISLAPSIVSSVGPLIDTLVNSGVSRYVKFKLLDGVGLYTISTSTGDETPAEERFGSVKIVPGSKEDVFKSKELGLLQKRKLMKFLMATASQSDKSPEKESNSVDNLPFLKYLNSKEVGLDTEVANAVAYALSLSSDPNEPTSSAVKRLQKYIRSTGRHGNSPFLIGHFGGAGEIAQGFCRASAVAGATYILGRSFSVTRITGDNSGPNFQLAFEGIDDILTSRFLVSRKSVIPGTLNDHQSKDTQSGSTLYKRLARCIAILDGSVYFSKPPANEDDPKEEPEDEDEEGGGKGIVDSAILIFPPRSLLPSDPSTPSAGDSGVVTAFISGPNSLACPDGKRRVYSLMPPHPPVDELIGLIGIIYLSTEIPPNAIPEAVLQPYLSALQHLNRSGIGPSQVLMSLFYSQRISSPQPSSGNSEPTLDSQYPTTRHTSETPFNSTGLVLIYPPTYHLAEFGDEAAEEAERVFWGVVEAVGLNGRSEGTVNGDNTVMEERVKRVDADGQERRSVEVADTAGSGMEDVEKVTVMWPTPVIDENLDDSR